MLEFFRNLVFAPRPPPTRMTRADVLALARAEAERRDVRGLLAMVHVRMIDGRVTWVVGTPTKGSGCSVRVDDATGEIGEFRNWGIM